MDESEYSLRVPSTDAPHEQKEPGTVIYADGGFVIERNEFGKLLITKTTRNAVVDTPARRNINPTRRKALLRAISANRRKTSNPVPSRTGSELHLGRIMAFVMRPEDVLERLGDLEEKRATIVAKNFGEGYSWVWYWATGLCLVAVKILQKAEPLVQRLKKIWNTPSQN